MIVFGLISLCHYRVVSIAGRASRTIGTHSTVRRTVSNEVLTDITLCVDGRASSDEMLTGSLLRGHET